MNKAAVRHKEEVFCRCVQIDCGDIKHLHFTNHQTTQTRSSHYIYSFQRELLHAVVVENSHL